MVDKPPDPRPIGEVFHDMRNLVASIMANAYFLRQLAHDERQIESITDIDDACRRLTELLNGVPMPPKV